MLPSYVRAVPNGTESGDFLALDLGGTNFHVLLIRLHGREAEMVGKIFRVPESVMRGTGEALFDHIAECMAKFMEEHQLKNAEKLPLGFTFSFPCKQEGLTKAKLINWTKGFNATGVEGADVVTMLREACARRKDIDIDVVAVLNDTVGTLMACAFKENSCQVGVIVGTGTNACYMEKLSNIPKIADEIDHQDGLPDEMIINTEWGAYGDDGAMDFVHTVFDDRVDEMSINAGKQRFEKIISGMYMGELVRVVLEDLASKGLLFDGDCDAISRHGCFPTKYVSEIESDLLEDEDHTFQKTYQILEDIGVEHVSDADCANVAYVCGLVSTRAAHLTAAGNAMLLNRMGRPTVTVGVDGSVYRFHPSFPKLLDEKIDQLVDGNIECQLMLSAVVTAFAAVHTTLANVPGTGSLRNKRDERQSSNSLLNAWRCSSINTIRRMSRSFCLASYFSLPSQTGWTNKVIWCELYRFHSQLRETCCHTWYRCQCGIHGKKNIPMISSQKMMLYFHSLQKLIEYTVAVSFCRGCKWLRHYFRGSGCCCYLNGSKNELSASFRRLVSTSLVMGMMSCSIVLIHSADSFCFTVAVVFLMMIDRE